MRKDIFDLFRERAAQIEETPSPQAWNRLERRLNSRRPSVRREARRVSLHRSLGMVASLALVLGLRALLKSASRKGTILAVFLVLLGIFQVARGLGCILAPC